MYSIEIIRALNSENPPSGGYSDETKALKAFHRRKALGRSLEVRTAEAHTVFVTCTKEQVAEGAQYVGLTGYTVSEAQGFWEGEAESCLTVTIYDVDKAKVFALCEWLRVAAEQKEVHCVSQLATLWVCKAD
jgi:hypothetical protein